MPHSPSPAAEIAAALASRAEDVCRRYLPQGKKQGRYWLAGDVDGAPGRSLFVRLPLFYRARARHTTQGRRRGASGGVAARLRAPRPRPTSMPGGSRGAASPPCASTRRSSTGRPTATCPHWSPP